MSSSHTLLAAWTLCQRELVRFVRQKSRMIGVIGSPLVFWFLIGSGLGNSFRRAGDQGSMNYLEYFFPGTVVLIILFTAIFSTISIIEDRREGFLQSVLVAPVSRTSIALGKILGGTILSVGQAVIMLLLGPFVGISYSFVSVLVVFVFLFLTSFGLTGLGFLIAWRMESSQGFHAIMNLFLIPLWLLSGSLFPASGAAGWLGAVMSFNPLTYAVAGLRQALYLTATNAPQELATLPMCLGVTFAFAAVMLVLCSITVTKRS